MAASHTPTGVEIDGILMDANRVSRREFVRLSGLINEATEAGNDAARDTATGELVARVVVSWPFAQPVTVDGYLDLGLLDSKRVDQAITQMMLELGQKKLESPSKPPENSSAA